MIKATATNNDGSSILPPVETTPIILIRFTKRADYGLIGLVEGRLLKGGLRVVTRETDDDVTVLGLTTTQDLLEMEAQSIRLMKRRTDTNIMEPLNVDVMDRYCDASRSKYDQDGLFNSNDWALLVWRILEDITVLPLGETSSNLSRKLDSMRVSYRRPLAYSFSFKNEPNISIEQYPTQGLQFVLQRAGLVDVVTSIHQVELRDSIWDKTRAISSFTPPADEIRQYYGEEIAFYFAWMGFLWKWLLFPGLMGFGAYCYRWYREESIMHDEYTPFYGLITFLWAVLFVKFWKREEKRLSNKWGTLVGEHEKQAYFATRPEFYGRLRASPITGQLEVFYPDFRRRFKFAVSTLITIFMLAAAFTAMICSLNLQGYINPKNDPSRWHEGNKHPFHFPRLAKLAEPGQLFDANSSWRCFVPVIMHVATIFTLNNIYRIVATHLTKWENHQTELSFENSLILKRFLFEAFDCYIALFYLAFYERNVDKLRVELVSVFNLDTIRRLGLECLLPYVLQRLNRNAKKETIVKKRERGIAVAESTPLTDESELDPYEQFDDYMEIVIQFGYVTLFASAYPLASLISVLANYVEIRSDCYKITKLCQRPRSLRTDGLGMWLTLLSCIVWLSALTNCLLFGFASGQMREFLPRFYRMDDTDHLRLNHESAWVLIFIIFGMERLLLFTGMLIHAVIPDTPEDVMDEIERKLFIMEQETRSACKEKAD